MSEPVAKVDGTTAHVYRGAGEIVFALDEDFNQTLSLNTASFLVAMEKLGFAIIPLDGVPA